MKIKRLIGLALMLLLAGTAAARVEFGLFEFSVNEFRQLEQVTDACAAPAASSFWCGRTGETLMRIPTKGADFFFNDAGELYVVYAKPQKGQDLSNYSLNNAQNLIPITAGIPGNAVLVDGEYIEPQDVSSDWEILSDIEIRGTFTFTLDGIDVTKTVDVSHITHTLTTHIEATRTDAAEGDDDAMVQLAFPGIGRADTPIIKLGQSASHAVNPISTSVEDASYISAQTGERNGYAIVMRAAGSGENTLLTLDEAVESEVSQQEALSGISLGDYRIALESPLAAGAGSSTDFAVETYTGPNELVRFNQEGYADLPGLFNPNILGRLSLGLIWLLLWIQGWAGSWGLSIILLTLVFRALICPLINTQTK